MQPRSDPLNASAVRADHPSSAPAQHTEILILPEGKVLVHNLTPVMAAILEQLNPNANEIRERVVVVREAEGPT